MKTFNEICESDALRTCARKLVRDLEGDNPKFHFTLTETDSSPWLIRAYRSPIGLGAIRNRTSLIAEVEVNFFPDVEGLKSAMRRLNDAGFKVFPNGFSGTKIPESQAPEEALLGKVFISGQSYDRLTKLLAERNPEFSFSVNPTGNYSLSLYARHMSDPLKNVDIQFEPSRIGVKGLAEALALHKFKVLEELKPTVCPVCGGLKAIIRGRHPGQPKRTVCPTCVVEKLEDLCSNATLSPASSCDQTAK